MGGHLGRPGGGIRHRTLPIVVLAVAIAGGSGCAASPFDPYLDEYVNGTGLTDASDLAGPYRVGKLVAVDPRGHRLDERLQNALPADLRAAGPDEVGTIVWVSWGGHLVGTYKDAVTGRERGKAYQGYCEITVIDRAAAVIVERRTFDAAAPPSTSTAAGDVRTEVDVNAVVRYIVDLTDEPAHTSSPPTAPALVPGSKVTIRLSGPDSGTYSRTEATCTHRDGDPLDEWSAADSGPAADDHSLGRFSFHGWLGTSPAAVESATSTLETTVRIGPIVSGRTYVVSTGEGGSGTFSLDARGTRPTITFVGKTASGVLMAWTVECGSELTLTPTPEPTPAPEEALVAACNGTPIPWAAPYAGKVHPVVVVDPEGLSSSYAINEKWRDAKWTSPIQLVVCVPDGTEASVKVGSCGRWKRQSDGVWGELIQFRYKSTVRVVIAETGKTLQRKALYGSVPPCGDAPQDQWSIPDMSKDPPWHLFGVQVTPAQINSYATTVSTQQAP
jgi:hypothetical protein